jgi:hypothetical protein
VVIAMRSSSSPPLTATMLSIGTPWTAAATARNPSALGGG